MNHQDFADVLDGSLSRITRKDIEKVLFATVLQDGSKGATTALLAYGESVRWSNPQASRLYVELGNWNRYTGYYSARDFVVSRKLMGGEIYSNYVDEVLAIVIPAANPRAGASRPDGAYGIVKTDLKILQGACRDVAEEPQAAEPPVRKSKRRRWYSK